MDPVSRPTMVNATPTSTVATASVSNFMLETPAQRKAVKQVIQLGKWKNRIR